MGLTGRLAAYAAARPRPFAVAVPGGTRARLLVESELRRRAWIPASGPMESALLVVCGDPGPALAGAVDAVWAGLPAPRARVAVPPDATEADVRAALDRPIGFDDIAEDHAGEHTEHTEHTENTGHEHAGHTGHGGHEGHMMGAPGGVAMAERAPDRDGLKLDVLHVPLGPVLADWPAGLRVRVAMQGDVVQRAEAEVMGGAGGGRFWDAPWLAAAAGGRVARGEAERRRAASLLDGLARFLAVAGWRGQAERARRLRDGVLAGAPDEELRASFARFARRTGRSRTLRWMIRGLGAVDRAAVERYGLAGFVARHPGDAVTRLHARLAEIGESLALLGDRTALADGEGPRGPVGSAPSAATLAALPDLLAGAELSAARLIVADLDPDPDQIGAAHE
ncbi:hypothetical protein [Spirillospora sp. NPDC029432]|uniref:hypothetical protein n=1 Tax=Spirillospora sp. NPDC029432 TaxID=3154599 RepID=UPI00345342E3